MKIQTLIGIILLTTLLGCSKLTVQNYSKITVGMPYDEVVKLIGAPDKCDDLMGLRSCNWGDDKQSVAVSFAGDKALLFSSKNLK
ncbi:MAG: hypothetical protein COS39_07160 [Hydrogenophilales bacterium CG03_land_8_20_14_0_80_62_28]|nr:hypothetical protein [Betaproteobacteria bacterium]OIO77150.1 MAG: hypothetical protein AUJ86_09425 [Hydrogenophilaceae bacterium CG1_02_62_390]PIV22535.1 MAG: hypothetical protein COS39_07160 [Hydrogenophilales bacterium CG03_land_8_20_14_0_80_62_28]PIW38304.1 MAG: hypothetical protein COW23_07190 [Hydrogenophilales bacterium CG15_BIG_FIL_POST_REV_8_21_14_020_62_31]PIW72173.1 MAG: hypothetical protein COW07_04395 [Hydrogenophilales bacterium CG12_big_fil_rev_8_21_14_0_65_61_21]PIX02322.1 M